jgi:hypothetical protein
MADPRCPDYALRVFDDEKLVLTVNRKTNEEAVEILNILWTIYHARDIGNRERQREANADEERQHCEQAKQEAAADPAFG